MKENTIQTLLIDLGLSAESSIEPFYPSVRDRSDVGVLRCSRSGVIFLSRSDHMDVSYYVEKDGFEYWSASDRRHAVNIGIEDQRRRKELLQYVVSNKRWMDIGTGSGGILDELSPFASETSAVEPQKKARESLNALDYKTYKSVCDASDSSVDVVSLFHVFEHFTKPLEELKTIYKKMSSQAKIYIEVPHANDFLISFLNHESFKGFTFWSEHLILHTRQSLIRFLEECGFKDIVVSGCQRYPLANHLHWLAENQPGGHQKWSYLRTIEVDAAYENMLVGLDKTDTLVAVATKP